MTDKLTAVVQSLIDEWAGRQTPDGRTATVSHNVDEVNVSRIPSRAEPDRGVTTGKWGENNSAL